MKKIPRRLPRRRASALAFTLILTGCIAVCAGLVVTLAGQEHQLTLRRIVTREASNAVETTLNHGISQIVYRVGDLGQISPDFLNAKKGLPLSAPAASAFDPLSGGLGKIAISDITLKGGYAYVPSKAYKIAVGNPTSLTDEFKGQTVTSKTVPLLASVTATIPGRDSVTIYAKASVVIRDSALFNYAIFYNDIPLEIAPGGSGISMTIGGSVRANGNIYMGGSPGGVAVLGAINSAGNIFYGRNPDSGQTNGSTTSSWYVPFKDTDNDGAFDNVTGVTYDASYSNPLSPSYDPSRTNPFFYANDKAELISMIIKDAKGTSSFLDSTNTEWKNNSTLITNGNVQDKANGVQAMVPAGLKTVSAGSKIIQPPTAASDPAYDASVESTKYANKAGLYIVVETTGVVTAFQNSADAAAYKASASKAAWITANPGKVLGLPDAVVTSQNAGTTNPTGAFHDQREKKTVTPVDINLGVLRGYVAGTAGTLRFKDSTTYSLDTPASGGWNGVVYVEVVNPAQGWTSGATTGDRAAVRVYNGSAVPNRAETNSAGTLGFTLATNAPLYTVGHINADGKLDTGSNSAPDSGDLTNLGKESPVSFAADAITTLSYNWGEKATVSVSLPLPTGVPGTVSVNNADGTTTSLTTVKNTDGTYTTTTSVVQHNTASGGDTESFTATTGGNRTGADTEISAALLVGVVKSAGKRYSGGVENFPRLLENWKGTTLRIRGSMVAMFESKYATGKWSDGVVYTVPKLRDWGFSAMFGSGFYPPGTPTLRNYRRMNFRYLSAAEYKTEAASSWQLDNGTTAAKFP